MDMRMECDSVGELQIPKDAYYGISAQRAKNNFSITGLGLHALMINNLVAIKKAAALVNFENGELDEGRMDAICKACDEIADGKFHDSFIVDALQGGAGTSANMNANEVIANRAIEILGGERGDYSIVHPNDHVNMSQSTNDVFPTAGKMTALQLSVRVVDELEHLHEALVAKAEEFDDIIKMGRTELQDAVPMRLGQEFMAYATAIARDIVRIKRVFGELRSINLGGTAIGTGINANREYRNAIAERLSEITGLELVKAENLIDSTQNLDSFVNVSSAVKTCAVTLSKMSNDLRLMSSGPKTGFAEINLPPVQNGSSIMPGKINPVIPEVVSQIAFDIIGNDLTITMAAEAGQLELNAFEPIIFCNLFSSLEILANGVRTLTNNCIIGISANREHCEKLLGGSASLATALCPYIGYKRSSEIAKQAMRTGLDVKNIVLREKLLDEKTLDEVLDPYALTE